MLESTQRTSARNTLRGERAPAPTRTDRSSLQSFASRFSAALANSADIKKSNVGRTGNSTALERSRSNSVTARPLNLLASDGTAPHRNADTGGRNILEIPMDQPPVATKAQTAIALYS